MSVLAKPKVQLDTEAVSLYEGKAGAEARESFWKFRKHVHKDDLIEGWWQWVICRALQRFYQRLKAGERPKLAIMAPPQHGKSRMVQDFLAWLHGHEPDWKSIYASYSDDLGVKANLAIQRIMDADKYQLAFPKTVLAAPGVQGRWLRNTNLLEFVDCKGSFRNTTVDGQITGQELHVGAIDDPIKGRAEANSKVIREKVWNWLVDDFFTRFHKDAGLIFIMTRWHVDDPLGRMLLKYPNMEFINYPAIAEEDETYRRKGEALFPEWKPLEFLLDQKQIMSKASWEALYQQHPIIVGGGDFPIDRFKIIKQFDRKKILNSVRYWDKACLTADTLIEVKRLGPIPISEVRAGHLVMTRNGWRAVKRAWLSKHTDRLTSVIFSDGSFLTGTPDHPVFTFGHYWVDLGDLRPYHRVLKYERLKAWRENEIQNSRLDTLRADGTHGSPVRGTSTAMSGTLELGATYTDHYIGISGSTTEDPYPLVMMSTTRTMTGTTTELQILNASQRPSIIDYTDAIQSLRKQCGDGIARTVQDCRQRHKQLFDDQSTTSARTADDPSLPDRSRLNSVIASIVDENVGSQRPGVPVYDLTVEGAHEFFANGVLVHNSTEDGGAFTAGVLMHEIEHTDEDYRFVIEDVRHGQWQARTRERHILQTAEMDGDGVDIYVEQEPGSGGKESAEATVRMLAGFCAYADKVTGSKEVRAEPYAAQVQGGNVALIRGTWNQEFLDEHEEWPNGKYKDQVDAAAGAFNKLTGGSTYDSTLDWVGQPERGRIVKRET